MTSKNQSRRPRGDHACFWNEERQRWMAQASAGFDVRGKRRYITRSGKTRTAALNAVRDAVKQLEQERALTGSVAYTVEQAIKDWFEFARTDVDEATRKKDRHLCNVHILPFIGQARVRKLTTLDVERWLKGRRTEVAQSTLAVVLSILRRALARAVKHEHIARNVADLAELPAATKPGRPSKSMTSAQARAILEADDLPRKMRGFIVLAMVTGIRVEEARALRWKDIDFGGEAGEVATMQVVRSVRRRGDTKTRLSRRSLALPVIAIEVLQAWKEVSRHNKPDNLVFCTSSGETYDSTGLRRRFRAALKQVPGIDAAEWTPRELRHTFVSLMSDSGASAEVIALLVGHAGTRTTEAVYRHQLTPVVRAGAELMDRLTNN